MVLREEVSTVERIEGSPPMRYSMARNVGAKAEAVGQRTKLEKPISPEECRSTLLTMTGEEGKPKKGRGLGRRLTLSQAAIWKWASNNLLGVPLT